MSKTTITEDEFQQWANDLYLAADDLDGTFIAVTRVLRKGVTERLGIQIIEPFTDGEVVRSSDKIEIQDRTWYVRHNGMWKELTIRADSNTRQYTDEGIYGWIADGTLVLWHAQDSAGEGS